MPWGTCLLLALASIAGAATLDIRGRSLTIPAPEGMVEAHDLAPPLRHLLGLMPGDFGVEDLVLFMPDSVMAALRQERLPQGPFLHWAAACMLPGADGGAGKARELLEGSRARGDQLLRGNPSDSVAIQRARHLVREDPDGAAAAPLTVPLGEPVGLVVLALGPDAYGMIEALPMPIATPDTVVTLTALQATATVVAENRGLLAVMTWDTILTTRSVAGIRRHFERWVRDLIALNPPVVRVTPPSGQDPDGRSLPEAPPRFDDYVYVAELPEVIERIAPVYPAWAREKRIEGTAMVQVLVDSDGRVRDTRVIKSIPGLDESAVEAARQYRFKPALNSAGTPVSVWVAIPIRFKPE